VSAKGFGQSYQWRKDGEPISGATSDSYTATDAGTYSVLETNSAGSVTSSNAVVMTPPEITVQPSGGFFSNGSASLSVSAKGFDLSYRWRKDGVAISGATSASYTATAAGIYSVVVTNIAGSVTSSGAVIVLPDMVLVKGGTLPGGSELAGQVVGDFSIGRTEVTWGEWRAVRDWSAAKGYDLAGVGGTYPENGGDNLPVVNVSWYDVVKWCNARSEREGKTAVYQANGGVYRSGDFGPYGSSSVTMKSGANGYRLPLDKEWEWAARGGVSSKGYTYSGSNVVGEVAWTYENSRGEGARAVGGKKANELGLVDMSGNAWEWIWDLKGGTSNRLMRGGSWVDQAEDGAGVSIGGSNDAPDLVYYNNGNQGFRVALSSGP
jgi:sulfatase modifying factor 1